MKKQSLGKKFLSGLLQIALLGTLMTVIIPAPVANAAAATSVVVTAKFNDTGLTACQDNILVTFTEPVCGDADCTEALTASNFVFTNVGGDAETISSVTHTAGNNWAVLGMDSALEANDSTDTLRVEEVYTPSGMVKEDSVLTVTLTADTTAPTLSVKKRKYATDDILLQFSEPVQDEQCNNSAISGVSDTDITYADAGADNATDFAAGEIHSTSRDWVYLKLNANLDATNDAAETIAPTDNKVYDMVGNEWTEAAAAVSTYTDAGTTAPVLSSAYSRIGADTTGGNDLIFVQFDQPVFGANTATGNLAAADFLASIGIDSISHTAGNAFVILSDDANKTSLGTIDTENNVDTGGADNDIFDAFGNAYTDATAAVAITDNTFPVLRGVWINQYIDHASTAPTAIGGGTGTAVRVKGEALESNSDDFPQEGAKMMKWTDATVVDGTDGFVGSDLNVDLYDTVNDLNEFTQVKFDIYYDDNGASANLATSQLLFALNDAADFTTASEWNIGAITELTWTPITIDLTSAVASGTALASQGGNPQFYGIKTAGTSTFDDGDILYVDNVRFSRGASSKSNQVYFEFSEAVEMTGDAAEGATGIAGSGIASATTSGDMTANRTFAGLGSFAAGTLTTKTLTNTQAKSADGSMYAFTLADRSGGIITTASPVTLSGLFTPATPSGENTIEDYSGNDLIAASTHTPETVIDTLDLTTAASAPTDFRPTLVKSAEVRMGWTAPSQTAATFSHYALMYGTTAGVSVASTLWDEATAGQSALATATTNEATVTGLTDGTTYYFNIAAVDTKGIPTTLVTEKSALPSAAGGSSAETKAPAVPTALKATVNSAGQVVLTWTDPTDSDLKEVNIAKSTGKDVAPASLIATVGKGVKAYTDTNVTMGDIVNYNIRAVDNNGNASAYSAVVSLTVAAGADSTPVVVEEEEEEEEEEVNSITIDLGEQNTSGQTGTATITEVDGMAKVVLAVTGGATDVAQPAHVHAGTCAEIGGVSYALTDVVNGASTTTLEVSVDELTASLPFAINVHKSAAEATTYVACGDITAEEAEEMEEGEEEEEEMEEVKITDVAKHWAKKEVEAMVAKGVIKGYKDGSFKPDNKLNRAEAAILLCRVLGIDETKTVSTKPFGDVDGKAWFGGCVSSLKGMKILDGSKTSYKPNDNINRVEFLKLVMMAYAESVDAEEKASVEALIKGKATTAFADLDSKSWYVGVVTAAKEKGFLMGKDCGKNKCIDAGANITRAEATTILYRVFNDLL